MATTASTFPAVVQNSGHPVNPLHGTVSWSVSDLKLLRTPLASVLLHHLPPLVLSTETLELTNEMGLEEDNKHHLKWQPLSPGTFTPSLPLKSFGKLTEEPEFSKNIPWTTPPVL